jgi:hypothetical protein
MSITHVTEKEQDLAHRLAEAQRIIERLVGERDALARDAERYRWLFNDVDLAAIKDAFDNNRAPPNQFHNEVMEQIFGFYIDKAGADAAIDAAMKGKS